MDAVLEALNADFFDAGAAGFEQIAGGNTIFDLINFDVPPALVDLLGGGDFENPFASLFGAG